jgi:hypothetical protein
MKKDDGIADSSRVVTHHNGDRFHSITDTLVALQALRRACLEWSPNVVADEVSQVLLEGQEPDATLARTTHEGIGRLIDFVLTDARSLDALPDWLTPPVIERISQRLSRRVP